MSHRTPSCPLFDPSDIIALCSDLHLSNDTLTDQPLGIRHHLTPVGAQAVSLLEGSITFADYVKSFSDSEDLHNALRLLAELNYIGSLLVSHRQAKPKRVLLYLERLLLGLRSTRLRRRVLPSPKNMFLGLCVATAPLFAAICGLVVIVTFAGLIPVHAASVIALSGFATFFLSTMFHEYAHWLILRAAGFDSRIIYYPNNFSVIHARIQPKNEIAVALCGPLVGITTCFISSLVFAHGGHGALAHTALLTAIFHLLALSPFSADGKALIKGVKLYATATS